MIETLVLAVGFFCGNAPLRALEITSAPGVLTPLAVPRQCPQPREPLFLELTCGQNTCAGRITEGSEAGHGHAALAEIDGPPSALRLRFTNEEGLLLSRLRISVVERRALGAADRRALAPVLAHDTIARVRFGHGSATFSGSVSAVLGIVGPRAAPVEVRLHVLGSVRTVELVSATGVVLGAAQEGSAVSVACERVGDWCKGKDAGEQQMILSVDIDPAHPPSAGEQSVETSRR
jgi:hypothetical protein